MLFEFRFFIEMAKLTTLCFLPKSAAALIFYSSQTRFHFVISGTTKPISACLSIPHKIYSVAFILKNALAIDSNTAFFNFHLKE